jgi:phospholipid/cholesterol/gamma-HCH transport system substrate-binding protein
MNKSRLEWKVGLFVLVSLGLAAALIMRFSKSTSAFTKTYDIRLVTSNVGGIRPGAAVLMAGVPIGNVRMIDLHESGKVVTLHAQILARFSIHEDARFTIEQAGFLGDQYIAVTPTDNKKDVIKPGQAVRCEEPFNLQEVARSGAGLIRRLDQTAARLDEAVARVDRTLLSEETLTNLSVTVRNFRVASERALSTLQGIDNLVQTNSGPLGVAVTNLFLFSEQLNHVSEELRLTIVTNRGEVTLAVQNVQKATAQLNAIVSDLQAGKGLAGSVLKDENLREQFASMMGNLNVVSSNLSRHGLLWRPRERRTITNEIVYPGKMPFR